MISYLWHLFSEDSTRNTRQEATPDVIEKVSGKIQRVIPEKFKADVEALEAYVGHELTPGTVIEVMLSELLDIIPRKRHRIDAYTALGNYLRDELCVQLTIKTNRKHYG